tara:strand:+ start:127899 stop:128591 length:693 start_codon:yes stop_codon:yes gene_type:complete
MLFSQNMRLLFQMRNLLCFFILLLFTGQIQAQKVTSSPMQLSGIVITNDSIPQFIPFANIYVKNGNRGTSSNAEGFFSFVALPGDTISFSVIGFKKEELFLPDSLDESEYLVRVVMKRDTTFLLPVTLYPWPTPDNFKDEFLAMRVPTEENDIAMRNLAIQELKDRAAEMGMSSAELQELAILQNQTAIYDYGRYQGFSNGGTAILGSLTNPFAWAEFFKALKRGDFNSK